MSAGHVRLIRSSATRFRSRFELLLAVLLCLMYSYSDARRARTVWDGVYTTQQAERGRQSYLSNCASCHFEDLRGDGMAPALVGNDFTLQWFGLSANDLIVRMRSSMPPNNAGSLGDSVYIDILTYVFAKNAFPPGATELKYDLDGLKAIVLTEKDTTKEVK